MIIRIGHLYFEHVEGHQVSLTMDRDKAHRFPNMEEAAPRAHWLAERLGFENDSRMTIEA